jgi:decaprenylphospho-beta-D-ribofuranose 2-oxidase
VVHETTITAAADTLARTQANPLTTGALRSPRGTLPRGLGRSYGDAALNSGGHLLRLANRGAAGIHLDPQTGLSVVEAGTSLDTVLQVSVPAGWFIPVSPGTRQVTIGGAIAAHIHGKNHHFEGSFGRHVRWIDLLTANGEIRRLTAHSDPDLWWATIGGMGLTGMILAAQIQLIPIETSRCRVDTERADNLEDLMDRMATGDDRYHYSVAWVDLLARGASLGRGVLTRGDHARLEDLDGSDQSDPLAYGSRRSMSVPPRVPHLVNRWAVRAFNEAYFRSAPRHRVGEITSISSFFHPLDAIANWNRLYGRAGFFQYQFVVPFGEETALRRAVELVSASGAASFLAVLKRFGPADEAMLGFAMPGWTLTLDLPAGADGLSVLVRDLDDLVMHASGRIYLAKDAVSRPEVVAAGYPLLDRWRQVCAQVDPDHVWNSDLARRLELR